MKLKAAHFASASLSERQAQLPAEPAEKHSSNRLSESIWLTPAEAAERVRLSKSHFLRMVRNGRGPAHVGKGRFMRFRTSDVDEWVAAGGGCQAEVSGVSGAPHHGPGAASTADETGLSADERVKSAIVTGAPAGINDRPDVHSKLRQLETDYNRDDNAVYPWKARSIARRCGVNLPDWVEDYLDRTEDRLMQMLNDVANGKGVGRQADQVGRAVGFDPGKGCRFKEAVRLERDRNIHHRVEQMRAAGIKLDAARYEVAMDMNLSYPTIERGHKKISEMIAKARDKN